MALVIPSTTVTIADMSAIDMDTACASGIQSPAGTPYNKSDGKTFEIDQYATMTVPEIRDVNGNVLAPAKTNTDVRNQVKDSTKLNLIPVIKNLQVSGGSSTLINSANFSFTGTETTLLTTSAEFVSPRKVLVCASFSLYTDVVDTAIEYNIRVGGASYGLGRFLIGAALVHTTISGSWVLSVMPSTLTFALSARRVQGTGTLYIDGWDTSYLSVIG